MYAVLINEQSLDLIATNNGGVVPEIKYGASGYPITYFVLPTNPNDPAEIVSIDMFFKNYTFIGTEATDRFRPIKPILEFVQRENPFDPAKAAYTINREILARMVAAHLSGYERAEPQEDDYDVADEMLVLLESKLIDKCPRCGGDHSWCQNVQPGEFGPE